MSVRDVKKTFLGTRRGLGMSWVRDFMMEMLSMEQYPRRHSLYIIPSA